ncbi:hypothetical protein EON80_32145, partial [bacterium]
MVGGVAGSVARGASATGAWASSNGGVLRIIGGFASTVLSAGKSLFTLIGVGAVSGVLIKAFLEAAKGAMEFSKGARLLSAQSGLSLDRSAALMRNLSAIGINQAPTGNAAIFGMKAGAFGLPGIGNSDFAARFAERFQSLQGRGVVGQLMAGNMTKSLGLDSPEWLRVATMSPRSIRQQQSYSAGVQKSLGLTPEALRAYSEEIPNFINRLGTLWEGVKMKLASTALPILQSALGGVTSWLAQNASKASGWIEYSVRWLFVKAPLLAMGAVNNLVGITQTVVNGVLGVGEKIVAKLPSMLGGIVQWVADTLRKVAANFAHYSPILVQGVAQGLTEFSSM